MRGLDTETHKGRVILVAVPDQHLELWRYRVRDQWRVLISWLEQQSFSGSQTCTGNRTTREREPEAILPQRLTDRTRGSKAVNNLPVSEDLPYRRRGQASSYQPVVNRGGPSAIGLVRFVCWNADYDAQAILKLISRPAKQEIYRFTRSSFEGVKIRFVPSKFLWLADRKARIWIYDLMQFYAMSLEKASRKLLNRGKLGLQVRFDQLLATLQKGGRRALQIQAYCRMDALLVEQIYEKAKTQMERIEVNFDKPVSCASIAVQRFSSKMRHHVPRYVNRDFQRTYRGGRIEGCKCGYYPVAYLSDIHSAYASVMSHLQSCDGTWAKVSDQRIGNEVRYAALYCQVCVPDNEYRCPSPVIGETQLIYPRGSWSQWLDLETYRLMEELDMIVKIKKGWQLFPSSDDRPFKDLEQMYQERLANPDHNWALKIVMNALYGKEAEQIGIWADARTITPFGTYESWNGRFLERRQRWTQRTNFVYAGAITAGIRSRMYREIAPESVIFYATDGVITLHSPNLNSGPGLGFWSEPERVTDLVVVGSGVYTYRRADGTVVTKLRGLESSLNLYELLDVNRRVLQLTVRRNWSLAQSVRQHKYAMFNELVDVPRYLDVCFDRKRIWDKPVRMARELLSKSFDSRPWFYYPPATYEEF